jgi:hypothetical protein
MSMAMNNNLPGFRRFATIALIVTALPLFVPLAACGPEKTGKSENGPDKTTDDPNVDPRKALAVDDTGETKAVTRFFEACVAGSESALTACFTAYAAGEAKVQYKSLDAYMAAVKKSAAAATSRGVSADFPRPYGRPGGAGTVLTYSMKDAKRDRLISFYCIREPGGTRIDHVLSEEPLELGYSAPVLGPMIPQPTGAFLCYYLGAFMGQHPFLTDAQGYAALTKDERLAYLRQCCTSRFIGEIKRDPEAGGDVWKYLTVGGKRMAEMFSKPELKRDELNGTFYVVFIENSNSRPLYHRFEAVREHGQWRLDRMAADVTLPEVQPARK